MSPKNARLTFIGLIALIGLGCWGFSMWDLIRSDPLRTASCATGFFLMGVLSARR